MTELESQSKLLSQTPRTDAACVQTGLIEKRFVNADFARQLERENVKLREALTELLECSPCQNGCAPDDMTCANNKARTALNQSQTP